ncbi:hypothetical protein M5D96_007381 [Drosophila gunungcola]|uniref:Uncharacterized protein n=1 Tax=Drosophila gunungcola TaxID=103775 RepID=A0A9P9YN28_9MUSC|nr:hypothetical protein M5D96_007381 [Drosophila gunungcola]
MPSIWTECQTTDIKHKTRPASRISPDQNSLAMNDEDDVDDDIISCSLNANVACIP